MLIQRVEIRNFLKHRTNGTGSGFVEIDFRSSPLWLIHGPNGAGKSAIFDAITFALFGRHRGSGSRDGKLYRLINDDADQAEINLEIELGGHRYLVQRKITRKGRKRQQWQARRRGGLGNRQAMDRRRLDSRAWHRKESRRVGAKPFAYEL